ncbi:MAG: M1 family metallopeptidase, partial [Bacteroidales bacterium]
MKRKPFPLLLLIAICTSLQIKSQNNTCQNKQNLYIPLEMQKAFEKGTRSVDGKPGTSYWQNKTDYIINVELEPVIRKISGKETITYFNNSPDTLRKLVIMLYPDYLKKENARNVEVDSSDLNDGVFIENLNINGKAVDTKGKNSPVIRHGTLLELKLTDALLPESSIMLSISWNFTLPKFTQIRIGMYDSTSFFAGYWYPKISVYDDMYGWDKFSYDGDHEFYNDYGNYDVTISVPESFIVWATGTLQNPKDLLTDNYYKKYMKSLTSDEIINIITSEDIKKGGITFNKNVWKFKAENVTDFAFGTSDHYLWDAGSIVVDNKTNRRVVINTAYKKESKAFVEVADIAKKTIKFLSDELPGFPYPYTQITAFNGTYGMEFPMIVNDGSDDRSFDIFVTTHEITHQYFPFYVGTNETKNPWLDEGLATFLPINLQHELDTTTDNKVKSTKAYSKGFGGKVIDIPIMSLTEYTPVGGVMRYIMYSKSEMAFRMLNNILGDELFKKVLQEFINRWHGKHPTPYDFFFTFNDVVKEDLGWFWKPWYFEYAYPDLAIKSVIAEKNNYRLVIENKGNLPVPVYLTFIGANGEDEIFSETARAWETGKCEIVIEKKCKTTISKIILGNSLIPDVNEVD